MAVSKNSELLKEPGVKQEIERHKWFESEKAGYDIGFDKAAESWIKLYSKQWLKAHPAKEEKTATRKAKRIF
ncbi:MAG: hypothetical protein HQL24_04490 [Candidatus Omnitrophica bacterium]|nr:hypothetical protein [Candidatus Omnitrophota bacterium]